MSTSAINNVVLQSAAKHTSTLFFLHGLGDTGHGWIQSMGEIRPKHMKIVCPTAPHAPVTLNAGFKMPSWFDLISLDVSGAEDEPGIKSAAKNIHKMITTEIESGIPANRIMIGGFSQGGALALYVGLTFPEQLAGAMALSCWLPLHKSFPDAKKAPDTLPIFQCHGDCDPVVTYKYGQLSSSVLKTFMKNVQFKSYQGLGHSSNEDEMNDLKKFVETCVPPQ